jgi:hypothetical protein
MTKLTFLMFALALVACAQRPATAPDSGYVFSANERAPTDAERLAKQDRAIMRSRAEADRARAEAAERADEADEKREAAIDAQEAAEDPTTRAEHERRRAESQKALDFATCATTNRDRDNPYSHGELPPGCEDKAP